jgi:hypothetical protein
MNPLPLPNITFDCVPLRSVPRWDVPLDASPKFRHLCERIRQAAVKHGLHNSYYLHSGLCTFHLTNDPAAGMLAFRFEGTVLTDPQDRKPAGSDLQVELDQESCDWLTATVVSWFRETVRHAVLVEFDRYIKSCDPAKTCERLQRIEAEMIRRRGFVGMGL